MNYNRFEMQLLIKLNNKVFSFYKNWKKKQLESSINFKQVWYYPENI